MSPDYTKILCHLVAHDSHTKTSTKTRTFKLFLEMNTTTTGQGGQPVKSVDSLATFERVSFALSLEIWKKELVLKETNPGECSDGTDDPHGTVAHSCIFLSPNTNSANFQYTV